MPGKSSASNLHQMSRISPGHFFKEGAKIEQNPYFSQDD